MARGTMIYATTSEALNVAKNRRKKTSNDGWYLPSSLLRLPILKT
jgi:hypothetical protein